MLAVAQRASADRPYTVCAFPEREAGEWHVLHTLSRQEKALAEELTNLGIAHFLPLVRQIRYYGRRKVEVELPLFTCYLFLRGSREDAFRADRTRRVANILPVCDQDRLDWELRNLHLALSRNAVLDPYPYLLRGARVQVRAGPFRGLEGIVDRRVKPNRLILQVEMLGRAVSLEVDAALLDVLEASVA